MTEEELHNLLNKAYLMGFNNTCEGYNGEYPFDDKEINPEDDNGWVEKRDANINTLVRTNEEEEKEVFNPCITEEVKQRMDRAGEHAKFMTMLDWVNNESGLVIEDFELEERKANMKGEMLKKYKIGYFDEIEATDEEQAKEFLLSHLSRDVENSDVTCFEITEIDTIKMGDE